MTLPCHLLVCCILSCHHVHCIAYVFVSCIRAFSPLSVLQSDTPMSPGAPFCLFSCAGVKLSRNGPRFAKRPWYSTGRPPVKFRAIWRSFDTPTVNRVTVKPSFVAAQHPFQSGPKPTKLPSMLSVVRSRSCGRKPLLIWTLLTPSTYKYVHSPEISGSPNPSPLLLRRRTRPGEPDEIGRAHV